MNFIKVQISTTFKEIMLKLSVLSVGGQREQFLSVWEISTLKKRQKYIKFRNQIGNVQIVY
jgi:hypothetical protein